MTDTVIFTLPEEARPEHIENHIVPLRADGSLHLDRIRFRAFQDGLETAEIPPTSVGLYRGFTGNGYNTLFIPIIEPEVNYTIEIHTVISSGAYEIYVNGDLVDSGTSEFTFNAQTFFMWSRAGGIGPGAADPATYFYVWDFRVGTTRGGTDIFSDDLSSLPTSPPWGTANFQTISGLDSYEIASVSGIGNVTKINMLGNNVAAFSVGSGQLGFTDEEWQYYNLRFPSTFIENVINDAFYSAHNIEITFGGLGEASLVAVVNQ